MASAVNNSDKKLKTSKDLLKSEYVTESEHVLNTLKKQDKGKLKTFPMKCSALSKVKELLPKMLLAQTSLNQKSDEDINIENVEGCDKIIEMNIALYENSDTNDSESDSTSDESDEELSKSIKPLVELIKENN